MTIFNKKKRYKRILLLFLCLLLLCAKGSVRNRNSSIGAQISGAQESEAEENVALNAAPDVVPNGIPEDILSAVPPFSGEAYVELNNNFPYFTPEERTSRTAFENYSELDGLGRCGAAYANICVDIMPTEERGEIGQVRPSGWHLIKYDNVDGKYLYNRCHLIAYQLAGENANEKNLITATRYLNVSGMLPFENKVADYVKATKNHVLYRVTPVYHGDDLVAAGVVMEAYSVEDEGAGICYNVFVYNSQPGIGIDYATGESWLMEEESPPDTGTESASKETSDIQTYILNTNTKKFHLPSCESVADIKEKNKREVTGSREDLIDEGYSPCQRCRP